jgi:hypothetical protein
MQSRPIFLESLLLSGRDFLRNGSFCFSATDRASHSCKFSSFFTVVHVSPMKSEPLTTVHSLHRSRWIEGIVGWQVWCFLFEPAALGQNKMTNADRRATQEEE